MKSCKLCIFLIIVVIKYGVCTKCSERVTNANISDVCRTRLQILCDNKDTLFTMWDSSSRIFHTGITSFTHKDLGNYDLCMTIDRNIQNVDILGKFCPYHWAAVIPEFLLKYYVDKMENFDPDPVNITTLPFSQDKIIKNITIIGSMCILDGCTVEEFVKVFKPYVWPFMRFNLTDIECLTKYSHRNMSLFELIVTICIALIVLIMTVCTLFHIWLDYNKRDEPHDLVKAFSILYNGRKLISVSHNKVDQVQCINGMRFLSMLWIVAGHSFSGYASMPFTNHQDIEEWPHRLYSQYIQAAHFAVDTFFFLSGFLLAYGYMKQVKELNVTDQIKGIPLMYLHRYLRLTPAVGALFFVTLSFWKLLGDGPLWFAFMEVISKPCRKYWWRFFLYVQNYTPDDFCYTHTWYLSADMQMFILAPLVLIPCSFHHKKNFSKVMSALVTLILICVGISIAIPYIVDDYSNDYDTHSRLSNYIIGIIGGIVLLRSKGKRIRIPKALNMSLWLTAFGVMIFLSLYMNDVAENPTKIKSSIFNAVSKPVWCLCIFWIIFACYFGYGGIINEFLSLPVFQIGARISYCMYIVHVFTIMYIAGQSRTYLYFSDYFMYYFICGHVITSIILSTLWTFTFESPMIILDKMLFRWIDSLTNEPVHESTPGHKTTD